jgi:hypothetical protein
MSALYWLKRTLEVSVKRQGEKPLTNAYLLNIVNLAIKAEEQHTHAVEDSLNDTLAEDKKWGSS